MDVGELLKYKPHASTKRVHESNLTTEQIKTIKTSGSFQTKTTRDLDSFFENNKHGLDSKPKIKPTTLQLPVKTISKQPLSITKVETDQHPQEQEGDNITEEERQMKLLEMWEEKIHKKQVDDEIEEYDSHKLKKMILTFEKKVLKNQEMRIKFPDSPDKFMESELDLNDIIVEMKILATMPNQCHYLVEFHAVNSLLMLMNHTNTDIAIAVVDLIQELTDADLFSENEEVTELLIDALIDGQLSVLIVQNLERLDETVKEEAQGVHNSLAVIENILEAKPELCPVIAKSGLIGWILKRLKVKLPFDGNKLYCSEILSILLQEHDETRQMMGEIDGIDIILQQLAIFKRNDPKNTEEIEYMENIFNTICSILLYKGNRSKFLQGEGLQLMNLMLREKKMSRNSALRVLDHAMSGQEGSNNCTKFVEILGLRTLFPLFMKSPKKNKKIGTSTKDHEEHVVSIIASMLHNLKGSQRQRLLSKFSENDFEKVDRLMELHFKYCDRIQAVGSKLEKERSKLRAEGEDEEELEEIMYLRRLETGLFTLQQTDYIVVDICASSMPQIKQRVLKILNLRGGNIKSIRSVIREYAKSFEDVNSSYHTLTNQRIIDLANKF